MKIRLLITALGAVGSFGLIGPTQATHFVGWYADVELGPSWIQPESVLTDTQFGGSGASATFNPGWAALGTVGVHGASFLGELELGFRANQLNQFNHQGTLYPLGGHFNELSFMFNLLYDPQCGLVIDCFFGLGVGGDYIWYANNSGFHPPPTLQDTDAVLAGQAIAGLSYHFLPNVDLFVKYRFLKAYHPSFQEFVTPTTYHDDNYYVNEKNTLTVGFRFH